MKIVIPMAGNGSRFADAGFSKPKPFIDIYGKPMIRRVVESLDLFDFEHIFIARKEHQEQYKIHTIFPDINYRIITVDRTTQGAAISVSLIDDYLNRDEDILIVNSDQLLHYDSNQVREISKSDYDGCIWCFYGSGAKWSYVKLDHNNLVCEVAEKKEISNIATGGMYYWKSYHNYLECLRRMKNANDTVNNEFYVAPVYNYMLKKEKVQYKFLNGIDQLGTPEDLVEYENKIRLHRND